MLRHQRTGWGGAGLMRRSGAAPFDDDEQRFLRHVAPSITAAIRASLVRSVTAPVADRPRPAGPGGRRGRRRRGRRGDAGCATLARAARCRRSRTRPDAGRPRRRGRCGRERAHCRAAGVHVVDGTWLVVRSAPLGGRRGIVTIEEAGPPDVVAILGAALGLSARETDVVVEVLRGVLHQGDRQPPSTCRATPSRTTSRRCFNKAGVNSRRELIADVFFGIYAPRLGRPVGADGFFADPSAQPDATLFT